MNGELILQTLTARRIEPEPFQFINTPLNLAICRRHSSGSGIDLAPWVRSLEQSLQTAAVYSAGFPISSPQAGNAIGQKYFGPVVLVTDALCYSTTDIFAAGFQDHHIGPVLGADGNTGAGGANVWMHDLLRQLLPGSGSPYQPLPSQAGMRVSIRRCLRVGPLAGTPLEDLGVVPDDRHFMTRDDLLNGNVDLINKAGSLLAQLPVRSLTVTIQPASPALVNVTAETEGISRLDVYVNDRPVQSLDLQGNSTTFSVPRPDTARATLELQGYDETELVARYRTEMPLPS